MNQIINSNFSNQIFDMLFKQTLSDLGITSKIFREEDFDLVKNKMKGSNEAEAYLRDHPEEFWDNSLKAKLFRPRGNGSYAGDIKEWISESDKFPTLDFYLSGLRESGNREQANHIENSTRIILDKCHDPKDDGDWANGRRGLVYGQVQSGKTANYIGLIARAIDSGYKIIIVLAGLYDDLRIQTHDRIKEKLVPQGPNANQVSIPIEFRAQSARDIRSSDVESIVNDFHARKSSRHHSASVYVIKKNKSVLESFDAAINDYCEANGLDAMDMPVFIIDDEADHGSIRSMTKSQYDDYQAGRLVSPDEGEDDGQIDLKTAKEAITAINRYIRTILGGLAKVTFVQYTATPYSVLMQTTEDREFEHKVNGRMRKIPEDNDLFPEHFVYVLNPGENYMGLDYFFNETNYKNLKSDLRPVHIIQDNSINSKTNLPNDLPDVILDFIAGTLILRERDKMRKAEKYSFATMLIHPSTSTRVIENHANDVKRYITLLRGRLLAGGATEEVSKLRSKLMRHCSRAEELKVHQDFWSSYDLEKISDEMIAKKVLDLVLNNEEAPLRVISYHSTSKNYLFNLSRKQSLIYNDDKNKDKVKPHTYIVVGGTLLSRGLTLENLITSYLVRHSKQLDTLGQMARWYGYRSNIADIVSVHVSNKIRDYYLELNRFDTRVRQWFNKIFQLGLPPSQCGDIHFDIHGFEHINVASPSKLRRTRRSRKKPFGVAYANAALVTSKDLISNFKAFKDFYENLPEKYFPDNYHAEKVRYRKSAWFYQAVPSDIIFEFLENLKIPRSNSGTQNLLDIIDALKLDNQYDTFFENGWSVEIDHPRFREGQQGQSKLDSGEAFSWRTMTYEEVTAKENNVYEPLDNFESGNWLFDLDQDKLERDFDWRELRQASGKPIIGIRFNKHPEGVQSLPDIPIISVAIRVPHKAGMIEKSVITRNQ